MRGIPFSFFPSSQQNGGSADTLERCQPFFPAFFLDFQSVTHFECFLPGLSWEFAFLSWRGEGISFQAKPEGLSSDGLDVRINLDMRIYWLVRYGCVKNSSC